MATVPMFGFSTKELNIVVYYDDTAFRVTSVEVSTGSISVYVEVKKLTNPKRTFNQTFPPNTNVVYNLPNGFNFTLVPDNDGSGGYSCPDITCYVRSE